MTSISAYKIVRIDSKPSGSIRWEHCLTLRPTGWCGLPSRSPKTSTMPRTACKRLWWRVARQPDLLASVASPWAYLLRIVRNEALLIGRRKRQRPVSNNLSDLVTFCRVDELEREETHREVWSALRALPPEQAEVVVLKIWEELTFAQIGEILDTSPNTAASRYQYAMAKLTKRLAHSRREVYDG